MLVSGGRRLDGIGSTCTACVWKDSRYCTVRRRRSASRREEQHVDDDLPERAAAVLAEMELAFVLFMLISSWAAFEQWKKFVLLLCSCDPSLALAVP